MPVATDNVFVWNLLFVTCLRQAGLVLVCYLVLVFWSLTAGRLAGRALFCLPDPANQTYIESVIQGTIAARPDRGDTAV
jgi:hypothetical protein